MNNFIDPINHNLPVYNNGNTVQPAGNDGSNFLSVFNDALNDQIKQSMMTSMNGLGGFGGLNGIGGPDALFGSFMPSATTGMENVLMATAETGEMSAAQLMLFMMLMMMQSSESGGEFAPIMQMLAAMLSESSSNQQSRQTDIMWAENTDPSIRRMIDAALSQVGYHEKNEDGSFGNGNMTKFGAWYGMDGQPWCAMFVSWAADQAGMLNDKVPKHASTSKGVAAYQERGLFVPQGVGYLPREGDAIYFRNQTGRVGHVGIVVAVDPAMQRVYTVEGNTGNAVRVRHYDLNSTWIHGYGRNGGTGNGVIPGNSTTGIGASTV